MKSRLSIALVAATVGAVVCVASTARAQDCTPPRILFLMDMSSSMHNTIDDGQGGTTTKWEAARTAIHDVLTTFPDDAQYGLMTFPGSAAGCAAGEVVVQVGVGQATAIDTWMTNNDPAVGGAYTPAGQSLMAASNYGLITDPTYENYVVFVTDGYQWCDYDSPHLNSCVSDADCTLMGVSPCPHTGNNPSCDSETGGCYCVQDWPVIGTQALTDAQVTTYVVGFGESVNARYLNEAADVGGTAHAGCDPTSTDPSCYFQATVSSELTAALGQIVQQVVTEICTADCDIEGERTCTAAGWSDCVAPTTQPCTASCGLPGTQECVNGVLTECSSEPDCGTGGGGTGASGGFGGTGAYGGSGLSGAAGGGISDDPEDEGGCGCRSVGQQGSAGGLAAFGLLLGLVAVACARRRRS